MRVVQQCVLLPVCTSQQMCSLRECPSRQPGSREETSRNARRRGAMTAANLWVRLWAQALGSSYALGSRNAFLLMSWQCDVAINDRHGPCLPLATPGSHKGLGGGLLSGGNGPYQQIISSQFDIYGAQLFCWGRGAPSEIFEELFRLVVFRQLRQVRKCVYFWSALNVCQGSVPAPLLQHQGLNIWKSNNNKRKTPQSVFPSPLSNPSLSIYSLD